MAGAMVGSVLLAVMTGRWYLALLGLAYPITTMVPVLLGKVSRTQPPAIADLPDVAGGTGAGWADGARGPLALRGEADAIAAVARAILLARRARCPVTVSADAPGEFALPWHETWFSWLPGNDLSDNARIVLVGPGGVPPSWARAVADVSDTCVTVVEGDATHVYPLVATRAATAQAVARAVAGASAAPLPAQVRYADLPRLPRPATGRSLKVPVGADGEGPVYFDMDEDGPHLLVAGTTGAGKSAFLETLVLALANDWGPDDVTFALLDFKGGAAFGAMRDLPHVAGLLTDLTPDLADRALAALAVEISARKRALAEAGFASFALWEAAGGAPPRLIVIADEFQELAATHREALPDLVRLAAQGRSLGLHLVLATQRPQGAVTPEIRANITTTVALRVASESESRDLVGSPDAAFIPRDCPGRAITSRAGSLRVWQVALPGTVPTPALDLAHTRRGGDAGALAAQAAAAWRDQPAASPLWLDALPAVVAFATPRGDGIWLGRFDDPTSRTQGDLWWSPRSGALAVAGPPGSGRTATLRLVAAQARAVGLTPVWLPEDPREAARTVALASGRSDVLLIVDDALRSLARLSAHDRGEAHDALVALAAAGAPLAYAVPVSGHHRMTQHAGTRVVLAGGTSQEDAAWGVPRALSARPYSPGAARVGRGEAWSEGRIAYTDHVDGESLVTTLPGPSSTPPDFHSPAGQTALGWGGDACEAVLVPSAAALVVIGPPSPARHAAVIALEASANPERITVHESIHTVPPAQRSTAVLVLTDPTGRAVRECYRGDSVGLADDRPGPGRVVVIANGAAMTTQLWEPTPSQLVAARA